jgi:hypothetical protein
VSSDKGSPFDDISNMESLTDKPSLSNSPSGCSGKAPSPATFCLGQQSGCKSHTTAKIIRTTDLLAMEPKCKQEPAPDYSNVLMGEHYSESPSFFHNLYKRLCSSGDTSIS